MFVTLTMAYSGENNRASFDGVRIVQESDHQRFYEIVEQSPVECRSVSDAIVQRILAVWTRKRNWPSRGRVNLLEYAMSQVVTENTLQVGSSVGIFLPLKPSRYEFGSFSGFAGY